MADKKFRFSEGEEGGEGKSLRSRIFKLNRRLRILEESLSRYKEKVKVLDKDVVRKEEKLNKRIDKLKEKIDELKEDLDDTSSAVKRILRHLDSFARKRDVKSLEKYVDLFDPTRYLTEKEVKRLIREEIKKM